MVLEWTFEPVLTVGGDVDGPEAFYQVDDGAVAVDGSANLYVLDRGNHRIVVFDPEGRHLRSMGRQGGGPGEFQQPRNIGVSADGVVEVFDYGKRGLVRFDAADELLESVVIEGLSTSAFARTCDGLIVDMSPPRVGEQRRRELVLMRDTASHVLVSLELPPARPVNFGCVLVVGMSEVFAQYLVWAAGGDRIAAVTGSAYVIDLYENGGRATSVRRDVPIRASTRELAAREVGEPMTFRSGRCSIPVDEVIEKRGYADVVPAIGDIAVSPDGSLWVQRREVGDEPRPTDVFTPSGRYVGTLPPGSPFPAAFTPNGKIVVVELDELDVPRVVVYRIAGAGDARR